MKIIIAKFEVIQWMLEKYGKDKNIPTGSLNVSIKESQDKNSLIFEINKNEEFD